jgi:beta-glucosidase/6-phospho-beta-glucosidase/beta-galactosidase
MYQSLSWVTRRYHSPVIIVTENGCDIEGENDKSLAEALQDDFRSVAI